MDTHAAAFEFSTWFGSVKHVQEITGTAPKTQPSSGPVAKGLLEKHCFINPHEGSCVWGTSTSNEQVNKLRAKLRAKSRTNRDPFLFGHMCPRPGGTLPEVTTSWPAEGHTGCTGSGGTWQSAAPWPRGGGQEPYWVKGRYSTHSLSSDQLLLQHRVIYVLAHSLVPWKHLDLYGFGQVYLTLHN